MPYPVTKHEQAQLNRAAVQAMRSSLRWERQNVYRLCPVGMWIDEAHYLRDLARNDGTPRSIQAQRRAAVDSGRALGRGPDQLAADLGRTVGDVSRALGSLPIWAEGKRRLEEIADQERLMLGRQPAEPPVMNSIPGGTFVNANVNSARTPPGYALDPARRT